jgi:S1-C subfamily serine protease
VNWVDPLVLLWVALSAVVGYGRGLVAQALSLVGLAIGGFVGSRVAPLFLPDGKSSPWVPLASLVGAVVGAVLFQLGANLLGQAIRATLARGPLRLADAAGGVVLGAAVGLAVAWLAAVAAMQVDRTGARQSVRDSAILSSLVEAVPPSSVLQALARFDPLPVVGARPDLGLPPPDPSVTRTATTARAAASVVKVLGFACGIGVQGSGWVVRRGLVATNAHVVAGQETPRVAAPNGRVVEAIPVYYNAKTDVALLSTRGLGVPALRIAGEAPSGDPVVLLGYPNDGPLTGTAVTAGHPRKVLAPDIYTSRLRLRTVVPLRGRVEHGESGGPVIDREGNVVAMVFAAARQGQGGFGVPTEAVEAGLDSELTPVSTGPCA